MTDSQQIDPPAAPTIEVAAERFIAHCRTTRGLSAYTLQAYASDLGDIQTFLGARTSVALVNRDLVLKYVQNLLETRKLKHTTVRRRAATVRVFFAWLEVERVIATNPLQSLKLGLRMPQGLPRALRSDEVRVLLRAGAGTHRHGVTHKFDHQAIHLAIVALFTTGLRIGELVSANVTDTNPNDGSIHVRGKGNRERRVYMPGSQALAILRGYMAERRRRETSSGKLLINHLGRPISARAIRLRIRTLAADAGIARRITPHMLRHTAATQLLNAGVDIRFVQRLLGHASISTTHVYTHVSDESLREHLTRANTFARVG